MFSINIQFKHEALDGQKSHSFRNVLPTTLQTRIAMPSDSPFMHPPTTYQFADGNLTEDIQARIAMPIASPSLHPPTTHQFASEDIHPIPLQPKDVPFAPPPHVFQYQGWPPLPEVIPFFGQKILTFAEMEHLKNAKELPPPGVMLRDVFNHSSDFPMEDSLANSDLEDNESDKGYDASDEDSDDDDMPVATEHVDSDDESVSDDEDDEEDMNIIDFEMDNFENKEEESYFASDFSCEGKNIISI